MTPGEVSTINIDANARLAHAVACFGADGWRGLLGEFQLAFVLLMSLSSMAALEQWKRLAHVVCSCAETAVFDYPELYLGFVNALEAQLARAGEDFFVDDYTEDNFLRPCMVALMRIDVDGAPKREVTDMDVESTLDAISSKLAALARGVREKFDVDLVEEAREAKLADARGVDTAEDGPVVVELSEGHYMAMDATNIDESGAVKPSGGADAGSGAERMSWMREDADRSS
jgi:A1 cistron-splicing factor AAR2